MISFEQIEVINQDFRSLRRRYEFTYDAVQVVLRDRLFDSASPFRDAAREGVLPHLSLEHLDFSDADLSDMSFTRVDFTRCRFIRSNLYRASFRGCDLTGASFEQANLSAAMITGGTLKHASFKGADLRLAGLADVAVSAYHFRSALLGPDTFLRRVTAMGYGPLLTVGGVPSGDVTVWQMEDGDWRIQVGCWGGSVSALREMIASDDPDDWVEADEEEIPQRRAVLAPICDLVDGHIKHWVDRIPLSVDVPG